MFLIGLALWPTILSPFNYLHFTHTWGRIFEARLQVSHSNARVIVFGIEASATHFRAHMSYSLHCPARAHRYTQNSMQEFCVCVRVEWLSERALPDYGRLETFDRNKVICNGTERHVRFKDAFQRKPFRSTIGIYYASQRYIWQILRARSCSCRRIVCSLFGSHPPARF